MQGKLDPRMTSGDLFFLERFQEKCAAVLRFGNATIQEHGARVPISSERVLQRFSRISVAQPLRMSFCRSTMDCLA